MTFQEELKALLSEEVKVCKKLLDITFKKTDILVEGEIEKLAKVTIEEEKLINKVGNLEESRQNLIDEWGMDISIPLSKIIAKIPEGSGKIEEIAIGLSKVLEEIGVRNQLNAQLLKDSIDWIDFNVNLLTTTNIPTTYKKDDKGKKNINNSLFDRKV